MGIGSIGSFVALGLAIAGVTDITVYDPDVVASHNVPMSLYRPADIGRPKVAALAERIAWETGDEIQIKAHQHRFIDQPLKRGSLIACVDVMNKDGGGRTPLFERIAGSVQIDIFIDTRIQQWFAEIYTIVPTNVDDCTQYRTTLYPDDEMALQTCGLHGIGSMSMAVAGDAVNTLFRYWNNGTHIWRGSRRYDRLPSA